MIAIFLCDRMLAGNYPLSAHKKIMLEKTTSDKRKKELINGEVLLIKSLEKMGICPPLPLNIKTLHNGKPYLADENIFYNLSHSNNYFALAVSDFNIGIDIEEINDKHLPLQKKILSKKELLMFNQAEDKGAFITKVWTIKESYLKMLGLGLTKALDEIEIKLISSNDFEEYEVEDAKILCKKIDNYYLAFAYTHKNDIVEMEFF